MANLRDLLAQSRPFDLLTGDVVDALFARMHERSFADGAALAQQGAQPEGLHVLIEGEVRVLVAQQRGQPREVARPGVGAVIGEMSLLTREAQTADVLAVGNVRTLELAPAAFDELAYLYPEVSVVLTEILAQRLGTLTYDALGGKQVSKYRIVRGIGRGGMAAVYEAVDQESDAHVALKMMDHRLLFQPGARARFHREASLLLGMSHPNIAAVTDRFDAFRTSFLAMELCDGSSLAELMGQHGPCTEGDARACLGQLAAALSYLHSRRVVHRDMKPANVLLTSRGEVKLTDFGLAKPERHDLALNVTSEGVIVGTPRYMAPELLHGGEAGPLSDRYALGCIGLELLLGRDLFRARDFSTLLDQKERWSMREVDAALPPISDELREVLTRCMEHEPAARGIDLTRCAAWSAPFAPALGRVSERHAREAPSS